SVAISSTSSLYFTFTEPASDDNAVENSGKVETLFLSTKGLVSLRTVLYFGSYHEVQEISIFLSTEGDSDSDKLYETVENLDDDSAVCDDFDDSSDSASSCDNDYNVKKQTKVIMNVLLLTVVLINIIDLSCK
ncbi:hypothetical protein AAG570_009659, partial [Ranatra chinensis]